MEYHDFTVSRAPLLDVLRSSQAILDKKAENDAIKLAIIANSTLDLSISDGAMFLQAQIPLQLGSLAHGIPRELYLPIGILYDLIRRLDVQQVRFKVFEKNVQLEYGYGDFSLTKLHGARKELVVNGNHAQFTINAAQLTETLRILKATMSNDDIRDQFKGISVILTKDKITLWSTDGIKMSISELPIDSEVDIEGIWPRKFVEVICSITQNYTAIFEMYERHVKCTINNIVIISPLINAKLLDYRAIIDIDSCFTTEIVVDSGYLTKKLDRMMILSETGILFELDEESRISSWNKQQSDKGTEILKEIQLNGTASKFYVNGSIILGFIRNLKGMISVAFYEKSKNIIIRKQNDVFPLYLTKSMTNRKG